MLEGVNKPNSLQPRYASGMEIVVKLGKSVDSHFVKVLAPDNCSIADLIEIVRSQLPATPKKFLKTSETFGSKLFLSIAPDGPERLKAERLVSDYEITDGCTLWLMCAHVEEEE